VVMVAAVVMVDQFITATFQLRCTNNINTSPHKKRIITLLFNYNDIFYVQ